MTQPPGAQSAPQRTPLSAEEKAVSYANGREIVITFGQEEPPGLTGQGALSIRD
ncbi:MAG: hypothetical protein ACRDOU_26980 [Streptosporangiaceae bacterium]